MKLHAITKGRGVNASGKRVGRGNGSGKGTFSARGVKGQKSRTGWSRRPWFEGGQTPLIQKLPKLKGFRNPNREECLAVNLGSLERVSGTEVTLETLRAAGIISNQVKKVKILGNGDVAKSYTVKVHGISETAKQKIEAKGGSVELLKK